MIDNISSCGRDCYECVHFPHDCLGCNEVRGRVFWLEYVDEVICPIYNCCQNKNEYIDCGICPEHPCYRYFENNEYEVEEPSVSSPLIEKAAAQELPILEPKWVDVKVS